MTEGVLGIIGCPMLEDNLVWSLRGDSDEKDIAIVDTGHEGSLRDKLDAHSIPYRVVGEDDALSGRYVPSEGSFNLLVYMLDLGLHSVPEELRSKVEDVAVRMQPYVDAIGFYLGTCGTYHWDIPEWCEGRGMKPATTASARTSAVVRSTWRCRRGTPGTSTCSRRWLPTTTPSCGPTTRRPRSP